MFGRKQSVFDGKGKLGNEALGALYKKFRDAETRINARSLDYYEFVVGTQDLLEGKMLKREKAWAPFWCTELGTHATGQALYDVLVAHHSVEMRAKLLLCSSAPISSTRIIVGTVVVTPAYLGFVERPSFAAICERAIARGLALAPAELGPQFTCQYQGCGDLLYFGMEPIGGEIFTFERDKMGTALRTKGVAPKDGEETFDLFSAWVFVNPHVTNPMRMGEMGYANSPHF